MNDYLSELNIIEKMIANIFRKYTYKIYRIGVIDGYNWKNNKKE